MKVFDVLCPQKRPMTAVLDDDGSLWVELRPFKLSPMEKYAGMATHDVLQLDSKTTDQYISAMRSPCTWGGAIEIQAACNIWNARIVVHDIRSGHRHGPGQGHGQTIEFLPVSTNAADKTFELEWSGGHYEPVRR